MSVQRWESESTNINPAPSNSHFIIGCFFVAVRNTHTHIADSIPVQNSGLLSMQTALFDHLDTSYVISGVKRLEICIKTQCTAIMEDWMFTHCFQLCFYISLCMHRKETCQEYPSRISTKFKCYIKKYSFSEEQHCVLLCLSQYNCEWPSFTETLKTCCSQRHINSLVLHNESLSKAHSTQK